MLHINVKNILFIQSRFYLVLVKAAMTCQQFIAKVTQGCPLADPMKSKCVKIPVVHSLEISNSELVLFSYIKFRYSKKATKM
jgi:hypothetical protein